MCVYTKMRPYVSNAESNKNETKNEQYLKINRTHSPSYPGQKMMLDVCCAHTHTCSTVEHFRPEPTDRPTDTRISYRRRFKNRIQLFEALCCSLMVCLKEDAIENTNCCIYSTIYFNNSVSLRLMNISLRCVPMPTISPMETIRARLCSRWLLRYRFTHLSFGMAFFTLSHSLSLSLLTIVYIICSYKRNGLKNHWTTVPKIDSTHRAKASSKWICCARQNVSISNVALCTSPNVYT